MVFLQRLRVFLYRVTPLSKQLHFFIAPAAMFPCPHKDACSLFVLSSQIAFRTDGDTGTTKLRVLVTVRTLRHPRKCNPADITIQQETRAASRRTYGEHAMLPQCRSSIA